MLRDASQASALRCSLRLRPAFFYPHPEEPRDGKRGVSKDEGAQSRYVVL
jgi:hypothetical protein